MKKRSNNLIWAVLATAVAASLAVLPDGWVYGEYRKNHPEIPLAAELAAAVQDGILPWTAGKAETGEPEPAAEITAAVSEPAENQAAASVPEPAEVQESGQIRKTAAGRNTGAASGTPEETSAAVLGKTSADTNAAAKEEPSRAETEAVYQETSPMDTEPSPAGPQFRTVGIYYFSDACFIGDSFTDGLRCYAKIPKADFLSHKGVSTYGILKQKFEQPGGGELTLDEALTRKQYGKIYIMLGINEIGSDPPEVFAERYRKILNRIREKQPDALIFVQSILHTTAKKSASSQFKNGEIDAANAALAGLADQQKIFYLDINPLFDDENGALRADLSGDGVHIRAAHYTEWRDWLLQHGIVPEQTPGGEQAAANTSQ